MTRAHDSTRRRWTDRDEQIVRFCAEQWCADFATIADLCGTERSRTFRLIQRWRDEFRVLRSVSIRPDRAERDVTVIWPYPSVASERLGYPASGWGPSRTNIVHKLAVSRVRAVLCGLESGLWVPERTLLRKAAIAAGQRPGGLMLIDSMGLIQHPAPGIARGHVHDGRYLYQGRWLAVEVELTLKRPSAKRLTEAVLGAYQAAANSDAGLLYLYGTEQIGRALERSVRTLIADKQIPAKPDIRLRNLHRVIGARSIELPTTTAATA